MRTWIAAGVAVAFVAACGGSPPPREPQAADRQTAAVTAHGAAGTGEIAPDTGAAPTGAAPAFTLRPPSGPPPAAPPEPSAAGDAAAPRAPALRSAPHRDTAPGIAGGTATGGDEAARVAAVTVTGTPVMRVPANETIIPIGTATPTRTPTPPAGGAPMVGGCQVLPSDNPWNTDISNYPVHADSAAYIAGINASGRTTLHPDWGGGGQYGIPYIVVPPSQPMVSVTWTAYGDESDPGPYPIPLNAPIEGGPASDGDRHVLAVRQGECVLYELYRAFPGANAWAADSGAKWPLNSNALRPLYWTSADAAGLPVLPGLVRYDEVAAGEITHALRFTSWRTQRGFILPATHYASSRTDANLPPMGLRLRMKASYDISGYTGQSRVVLEALKRYGMMVADNGSSWFITGAADPRWDDEDLNQLKSVPSSAFEVVDTGPIIY